MNTAEYQDLIAKRHLSWGPSGPWRGETGNMAFITRSGHSAAIRRDAEEGFLYGAVAITNPDHPALNHDWGKGPAKVGPFERPVTRYTGTQKIVDLAVLPQGSWFIFACGYEGMGDLIPRWSHRTQYTYRTAQDVQAMCEALSDVFAAMWNEHLLKFRKPDPSPAVVRGQAVHAELERKLLQDQKPIAGVKQPQLTAAGLSDILDGNKLSFNRPIHPSTLRSMYRRCPDPLPPMRGQSPDGAWSLRYASLPQGSAKEWAPTPPPPKAPFKIEGWRTESTTVKHELKVVDKDTCQVTVSGRNGKVLAQFNIRYDGDKGAK